MKPPEDPGRLMTRYPSVVKKLPGFPEMRPPEPLPSVLLGLWPDNAARLTLRDPPFPWERATL